MKKTKTVGYALVDITMLCPKVLDVAFKEAQLHKGRFHGENIVVARLVVEQYGEGLWRR